MNNGDRERLLGFYEDALALHGDDVRSVHWVSEHTQRVRFEVLNKIAPLHEERVLDVGCGLGDLYKFFISRKISVDYTGIDIVPNFVSRARERFPDARFLEQDIFSVGEQFDYVLASGSLNFAVEDSNHYYFSMIEKMFACSAKGLAFNFLNKAEHPDDATYVSYDLGEMLAYCKTLTPHVQIVTGYLPWDATIYMYK